MCCWWPWLHAAEEHACKGLFTGTHVAACPQDAAAPAGGDGCSAMTPAEQRGAMVAAVQEPGPQVDDLESGCSMCTVELSVDETAGSVSVRLNLRPPAEQRAHPCRVREAEEAGARPVEPAEEGSQGREQQHDGELAQARQEVRAGVISLLERAACLEGVPDNEPEVRMVRGPSLSICAHPVQTHGCSASGQRTLLKLSSSRCLKTHFRGQV